MQGDENFVFSTEYMLKAKYMAFIFHFVMVFLHFVSLRLAIGVSNIHFLFLNLYNSLEVCPYEFWYVLTNSRELPALNC